MTKHPCIAFAILALTLCGPLAGISRAGTEYGKTVFLGDVSVGSWSTPTIAGIYTTSGGTYTNAGSYTNYYRLGATNRAGRIPVSAATNLVFRGKTNTTNAVVLHWPRYDGITRYVIERSLDLGGTWTNYLTQGPSVTNWTDTGTNTWTAGAWTNGIPAIGTPSVPWGTTSDVSSLVSSVLSVSGRVDVVETGKQDYAANLDGWSAVGTNDYRSEITNAAAGDAAAKYLPLAGGTMSGILDMGDNAVTNVPRVTFDDGSFISAGSGDPFWWGIGDMVGQVMWWTGNDGVGSGMDADLLDGQEATYWTNAAVRVATNAADVAAIAGLAPYTNHQGRADNPHTTTLQQAVNAGGGPVTNAPYLVQTNATDVTLGGFRLQEDGTENYITLKPGPYVGTIRDNSSNSVIMWNSGNRHLCNTGSALVAWFNDVFRVGPVGGNGTNLPVYATLTNHAGQIATLNTPAGIAAAGGNTNNAGTLTGSAPLGVLTGALAGAGLTFGASGTVSFTQTSTNEVALTITTPATMTANQKAIVLNRGSTQLFSVDVDGDINMPASAFLWCGAEAGPYVRLQAAGAVDIYTFAPTFNMDDLSGTDSYKLTLDASKFSIVNKTDGNRTDFAIDGNGRASIGHDTPSAKLHIGGTTPLLMMNPYNGTNMAASIDGSAGIFAAQDSADTNNVELWSIDDQGNVTLQTSHDGLTAVHRSHNLYTGKGRVVDLDAVGLLMNGLMAGKDLKAIRDDLTAAGKTEPYRTYAVTPVDWDAEQAGLKAKADADIAAWQSDTNAPDVKGERPAPYSVQPKPQWLKAAEVSVK
jgi:hypothetical protein